MKKTVLTVAMCLSLSITFSQSESAGSKAVFEKFKELYNAGQPDSIYRMFSAETQVNLPVEKTRAFLGQLKSSFGKIRNTVFLGYQAPFAQYKTDLEKGQIVLSLAVNEQQQITGLFAKPYDLVTEDISKTNVTAMQLPCKGEWTVFWGGDTRELNQHVGVKFQKNAFDIVVTNKEGHSFRTNGKTNEDYYAFGQPITAPCAGEVVLAVDGIKDNIPGVVNTLYIPGNTVIIRTDNNEYVFMAHFKQHSVKVKQGDLVKPGQRLGLCGNSGNSSEPHLHFHLQDLADPLQASGIKCNFAHIFVDGLAKTNYSPVKGERVSNNIY